MIRAAFVMGFGLGRANDDIVRLVAARRETGQLDYVLAQFALVERFKAKGITAISMHGHHRGVYVDTLDAAGLSFIRLYDLLGDGPCELEVSAHYRQFDRAHAAVRLAHSLLQADPSIPESFRLFLQSISFAAGSPPAPMCMNRWRESWQHFWRCSALLYVVLEPTLTNRRFIRKTILYESHSRLFYVRLQCLLAELNAVGAK